MEIRLQQKNYNLIYNTLPKAFDGFTIALISDLHDQEFPFEYNELVSSMIEENVPDVIMLAGDMHHVKIPNERYVGFLKKLTSVAPVFFAEGNHDCRSKMEELPGYGEYVSAMEELGVKNLRGDGAKLRVKGCEGCINISGMGWDDRGRTYPHYEEDAFNIFLVHDPEEFDRVEKKPNLMLAGHVHSGILRLPNGQGVFAPGNGAPKLQRISPKYFFPKYTYGLYGEGSRRLLLTSGLGCSGFPVRFLPPEVAVISLYCE